MRCGIDISPAGRFGGPRTVADLAVVAERSDWDGVFLAGGPPMAFDRVTQLRDAAATWWHEFLPPSTAVDEARAFVAAGPRRPRPA